MLVLDRDDDALIADALLWRAGSENKLAAALMDWLEETADADDDVVPGVEDTEH